MEHSLSLLGYIILHSLLLSFQTHCETEKSKIRIRAIPSLFQHMGTHSSLAGKIQSLKVRIRNECHIFTLYACVLTYFSNELQGPHLWHQVAFPYPIMVFADLVRILIWHLSCSWSIASAQTPLNLSSEQLHFMACKNPLHNTRFRMLCSMQTKP